MPLPNTFRPSFCAFIIGEAFDIVCFGGLTAYHATRVEGAVAATVLSSLHVRCVDMEMSCQANDPKDRGTFEKNTRAASESLMLYTAAIDQAWAELLNHERVSDHSVRVLQARVHSPI